MRWRGRKRCEREESGVSTEKEKIQITCESREKGRKEIQEGYTPLVLIVLSWLVFYCTRNRRQKLSACLFPGNSFLRRQVYSFFLSQLNSLFLAWLNDFVIITIACSLTVHSHSLQTDTNPCLSLACGWNQILAVLSLDFSSSRQTFSLSFWLHHLRFVSSNSCDFFWRQTWQFLSLFTAKTSPDKEEYTEVSNKRERIAFCSLVQIALQTESSSSSSTFALGVRVMPQSRQPWYSVICTHYLLHSEREGGEEEDDARKRKEKHLQELELRLKMCSLSSTSLFSHSFSLCFCSAFEKRAVLFREDCNARNFYLDFILFPLTLLLSSWVRLMYEPFGKKSLAKHKRAGKNSMTLLRLHGLKTASHLSTHFSLIFFPDSEGVSPQSFLQWIKLSCKFLPLCLSTACPLFLRPTQIPSITMNKTRGEGGRVSLISC